MVNIAVIYRPCCILCDSITSIDPVGVDVDSGRQVLQTALGIVISTMFVELLTIDARLILLTTDLA